MLVVVFVCVARRTRGCRKVKTSVGIGLRTRQEGYAHVYSNILYLNMAILSTKQSQSAASERVPLHSA